MEDEESDEDPTKLPSQLDSRPPSNKPINIRKLMKTNEAVATEMKELTHIASISTKYQQKRSSISD